MAKADHKPSGAEILRDADDKQVTVDTANGFAHALLANPNAHRMLSLDGDPTEAGKKLALLSVQIATGYRFQMRQMFYAVENS